MDSRASHQVNLVTVWDRDQEEPRLLIINLTDAEKAREIYAGRFWIEEMFSDHKSRGLNLESTRIIDPDRLERLLVAGVLAYLRIMEVGAFVWRKLEKNAPCQQVGHIGGKNEQKKRAYYWYYRTGR